MALKELRPSVMRSSEWWKREQRDEGQWQQLRDQIKRRDNWTCVYCGFRSYKFMMVNHIGAEDNHIPENLETICKPCHAVLHIGVNALSLIQRLTRWRLCVTHASWFTFRRHGR